MIKFVTISDNDSTKINNYRNSLKRDFVCLKYDKSLKNVSKVFNFYEYLVTSDFNAKDIIVYSDAYDIICINANNIEYYFEDSKKDIIYSSEPFCAHYNLNVKRWFKSHYNNCFLNAGFAIGYYKSFLEMYAYIMKNYCADDFGKDCSEQRVISDFFMKNKESLKLAKIDLDINSSFCKVISINTKFNPAFIRSNFIHVPWLDNPIQKEKYNEVVSFYLKGK